MRHLFILFLFCLIGALFSGCNPDCNPMPGLRTFPEENPPGFEILIMANNADDLKSDNINVFFGEKQVTEHEFIPDHGLKIMVPEGISGPANIRIEDGDCVYYPNADFRVLPSNYFADNLDFISPVPPQIIIPSPPAVFPPSIDNAWINPEIPEYCLWFIMEKIVTPEGDTVTYVNTEGDTVPYELPLINPNESFELNACLDRFQDSDHPFHRNPVSGIIDTVNNYISIVIDRTRIGKGTERFEGEFMLAPPNYADTDRFFPENCDSEGIPSGKNMMYLKSKDTGRHFAIFQPGS